MASKERWVYQNGKLTGKITTNTFSDGSKEIVRQKAKTDWLGGRSASRVISRTRITK